MLWVVTCCAGRQGAGLHVPQPDMRRQPACAGHCGAVGAAAPAGLRLLPQCNMYDERLLSSKGAMVRQLQYSPMLGIIEKLQ